MREKHPLGRRLLALTAVVCTLGSLAVVPAANAEQAVPDKPVAQQTTPGDPAMPQAGKADGVQKPETSTNTQPGNAGKLADTNTQQKPAAGNGDGGSADATAQDGIPIDEVHFPDAKFREYVLKNIDTDAPKGTLSQKELNVDTIALSGGISDASTWDLSSARGIEYFRNLKILSLSRTSITELDLSGNPQLEQLYLAECHHLNKLNITKNAKLQVVNLDLSSLSYLNLPEGDSQLKFENVRPADSPVFGPQLLAVAGGTFKGNVYEPYFNSGRAVEGDNLDLTKYTPLTEDELKGHIVVLPENWLRNQAGKPQLFDGTVLRPAKGSSFMTYLYFPRLGDREKWITNPALHDSKVPFMIVHLGFINPSIDEEWKDFVEADSSEFTPESWKQVEQQLTVLQLQQAGFEPSRQGLWDQMKYWLSSVIQGNKDNRYDGTGIPSAEWESEYMGFYESIVKGMRQKLRVTPIAPTRGTDSADANVVMIPASARAVSYWVDGKEYKPGDQIRIPVNGQIVVTAKVKDGWTLADNLDASKQYWTFKWQSQTVAPKEPSQNGDVLTVGPVTGVEYYYTYDKDGEDLQLFGNQTSIRVGGRPVWVVAKPANGYQFADNKTQVTYGPYSYTASNPPDNGGDNGGSGDNGNNNGGTTTPSATVVDVERFYNPRSGEHFYTAGAVEQSVLRASGVWRDEGVAFRMSSDKGTPVYRLYNPGGKHLFTTSEKERDVLIKAKWNYEGVAFYVPDGAKTDVHRLYNPGNGDHLLTTSANERGVLVMHKWRDEGIAFKAE